MRGSYCSVCMQAHPPVSFAYLRLITLPRQPHLFIREGRKQADSTHTHTHPTGSITFITTSSTNTHTYTSFVYSHTELMYLSRCTHAHSLPFFRSFTNHSSLSPASRRAWGDYYVNECVRGGGASREGGRGVRLSVRGVLLFLFSLSPYIAPRITAISTPEEYFNIRYSTPPLPSAPPVPDSCWETQRETERKR